MWNESHSLVLVFDAGFRDTGFRLRHSLLHFHIGV